MFFFILLNFGWMFELAMSIFEFHNKFLIFLHPWVCIRSDLKQILAIPPTVAVATGPLEPRECRDQEGGAPPIFCHRYMQQPYSSKCFGFLFVSPQIFQLSYGPV